jgi:Helix-turn-helix domain
MSKELLQDNLRVFVVPVEILEVEGLSIYEKMAYIVIRSHANAREASAWPSYSLIAKEASMSRRKAIDAVASLIEKGLLRKEIRLTVNKNRKIRNTSNLYKLEHPSVCRTQKKESTSAPHAPPLVHDMHHPSAPRAPEHNHLTNSIRNKMDGNAAETAATDDSSLLDSIYKTLQDNASICMVEDGVSFKDRPTHIDEIFVMLQNRFHNRLAPEIVAKACQLFSEQAYEWRQPFRMKIVLKSPVGFFKSCYDEALKLHKASKRRK